MNFELAVSFFLGKEIAGTRDDKSHVSRAGLIDSRKIHFVQNAVTKGEPDLAVLVEGCADAGLGAGSPARGNSRPAWSIVGGEITHRKSCPWPGNCPR